MTLLPLACCLNQEIADARAIRNRILRNFELSVQPDVSAEDQTRLLHIVIVGGGPTGVEFGAELFDFVQEVSVLEVIIMIVFDTYAEAGLGLKHLALPRAAALYCRILAPYLNRIYNLKLSIIT